MPLGNNFQTATLPDGLGQGCLGWFAALELVGILVLDLTWVACHLQPPLWQRCHQLQDQPGLGLPHNTMGCFMLLKHIDHVPGDYGSICDVLKSISASGLEVQIIEVRGLDVPFLLVSKILSGSSGLLAKYMLGDRVSK